MSTFTDEIYIKAPDTFDEVILCYNGKLWEVEVYELFPPTDYGCINFGYWLHVPNFISLKEREKSQLELYNQLINFGNIYEKRGTRIAEIGCGRGHGINILNRLGYDAYGVDITYSQINVCKKNYPHLSNKFFLNNCCNTFFSNNFLDFIISVEAAQHFPDFLSFAQESYRILKPKGSIALTTFFYNYPKASSKVASFIPGDISGTHKMIEIKEALQELENAGFKNIRTRKIGQYVFEGFCKWALQAMTTLNHTPLWNQMYQEGYLDYYMIHADKP